MSPRQKTAGQDPGLITETRRQLKRPPLFRVMLHNDDYTTREFVVQVLQTVFQKDPGEATRIMLHVHHHGFGICGIYPHEVAETKVTQVEAMARRAEFPLKCTMEEA